MISTALWTVQLLKKEPARERLWPLSFYYISLLLGESSFLSNYPLPGSSQVSALILFILFPIFVSSPLWLSFWLLWCMPHSKRTPLSSPSHHVHFCTCLKKGIFPSHYSPISLGCGVGFPGEIGKQAFQCLDYFQWLWSFLFLVNAA